MASLDLILDVEDGRVWRPGEKTIGRMSVLPQKTADTIRRWFAKFVAREYVRLLVKAIDEQRYEESWPALSERWLEVKEREGLSENIWEATSKLKESIDWWKTDKGWAVGIDPKAVYKGVKYKGRTLKVRLVAFWMEYGTGERAEDGKGTPGWPGMPPRPLFRPLRERISKDMPRIWDTFLKEFGDDVDELIAESFATVSV